MASGGGTITAVGFWRFRLAVWKSNGTTRRSHRQTAPANIVMLHSDEERAIMANAIQVNLRNPDAGAAAFTNIFKDVFAHMPLEGARVLDIGPGQCNFLDLFKEKKARTCGVDFDPAVVKLGQSRGHEMHQADFLEGWPFAGQTFDGIFSRGAIDCYRYGPANTAKFLDGLIHSLAPGGWLWIVPWNALKFLQHPPEEIDSEIASWADKYRIAIRQPSEAERARYRLHYGIPRIELWTRNIRDDAVRG